MNLPFTVTNDVISVYHDNRMHLVRKGAPNFMPLMNALMTEDWDEAIKRLKVDQAITSWANGKFNLCGNTITYNGATVPSQLADRILAMAAKGEDPTRLCLFWEKLQRNPSKRSVDQLWPFLSHQGIPLTEEGNFLAYKGVREDFRDQYSGKFDNSPGNIIEMPRNQISDDPNEACHEGLHVGALEYAKNFSSRVVICEVDPADVVCVPYDHSYMKMRVCKYKVVGNHSGELLPSTSYTEDTSDYGYDLDQEIEDDFYAETTEEDDDGDDLSLDIDSLNDAVESVKDVKVKVPARYRKIDALDSIGLLDINLDRLRDYAANGLKIVGASRIPGGKVALIKAIENVRRRGRNP